MCISLKKKVTTSRKKNKQYVFDYAKKVCVYRSLNVNRSLLKRGGEYRAWQWH